MEEKNKKHLYCCEKIKTYFMPDEKEPEKENVLVVCQPCDKKLYPILSMFFEKE